MYKVLLLRERIEKKSRVKDYIQLSGYYVLEDKLCNAANLEEQLYSQDIILVECNKVEQYFDVCEWLREMTRVPIFVLSECVEEWEIIKMFQLGMDDYLKVPFSQMELIARMNTHIERFHQLTRPIGKIEVRDLKINAFTREVLLRGNPVSMRMKEFDLLFYMAQMQNRVLSKEDIYRAVWQDELSDTYYNTVAVHMKRVREKLEDDPEKPQYIETIWGIGYRFLG